MVWPLVAAAAGNAVAQIGGALLGADAQKDAAAMAGAQQQAATRSQLGLLQQNTELARPLIETRDNALNALNAIFGLPQVSPSLQRSQQAGTALIPLPGVVNKTRASGAPDARTDVYFDPVNNTITDFSGATIAQVPASGIVPGVTHGKNNSVEIRDGRLYTVGNKGTFLIGELPAVQQAPQQAAQPGSPVNAGQTIQNLLTSGGYEFQRAEGETALNRALAARGLLSSGTGLKAGIDYNQGAATRGFQSLVLNPLFTLAGLGNAGTGVAANAGTNAAGVVGNQGTNLANLTLAAGQARGSAYAGIGQAVGNTIADLTRIYANRNDPYGGGNLGYIDEAAAGRF